MPHLGKGAGTEPHSHAPRAVYGFPGYGKHFFEAAAHGCLGTGGLPHQYLSGHSAPPFFLVGGSRGHVVVGHDLAHLDAVLLCLLYGHCDIHVVSGVVPVQHGHSLPGVGLAYGVIEHLGGRRREKFADCHGVDHVPAYVAYECGFVARTASGDYSYLTRDGCVPVFEHTLVLSRGNKVGMRLDESLQHLVHDT